MNCLLFAEYSRVSYCYFPLLDICRQTLKPRMPSAGSCHTISPEMPTHGSCPTITTSSSSSFLPVPLPLPRVSACACSRARTVPCLYVSLAQLMINPIIAISTHTLILGEAAGILPASKQVEGSNASQDGKQGFTRQWAHPPAGLTKIQEYVMIAPPALPMTPGNRRGRDYVPRCLIAGLQNLCLNLYIKL